MSQRLPAAVWQSDQHCDDCRSGWPPGKGENVWDTATPERQGLDSAKLIALHASLAKRQTHAFVIVRNNRLSTSGMRLDTDLLRKSRHQGWLEPSMAV